MKVTVDNRSVELKYTFNSFRYMEELDIRELQEMEVKPFKLITIGEILLMGALNNDPKETFNIEAVDNYLENSINKGKIVDLITTLVELLQDSDFFKSLQAMEEPTK